MSRSVQFHSLRLHVTFRSISQLKITCHILFSSHYNTLSWIQVQAQKRNLNGTLTLFQIVVNCGEKTERSKCNKRGINMAHLWTLNLTNIIYVNHLKICTFLKHSNYMKSPNLALGYNHLRNMSIQICTANVHLHYLWWTANTSLIYAVWQQEMATVWTVQHSITSRDKRLFSSWKVQTSSEAHLVSNSTGTRGHFARAKASRPWTWPSIFIQCQG